MWGAFAFGTVLGWFLYFTNRYRKGDTQLSDVATLIGVIGGSAVTALFGDAKTTLFAAYGLGLAAGFFAYFIVLVVMVRMSGGVFTVSWFLDGRRRRLEPNEFIPEGTRVTSAPMSLQPPRPETLAAPAPAFPTAMAPASALDVIAGRDDAIGATSAALRKVHERLDDESDEAERNKLFEAERELNDKREELVALRIRAALDSQEVRDALAQLSAITSEMQAGAAQMKSTADALAQAAKIVGLASKVIGIVGAFA
jgi:hypothetical protein